MEQSLNSLSLLDFQERFNTTEDCLRYLSNLKWSEGYSCKKCGHKHSCAGAAAMSRQCTSCRYVESPTAGTIFHQVKFDLVKAFWIVYLVSTNEKGITSHELGRKLGLRQKTSWYFKSKVIKAMKNSGQYPITGTAEIDETVFGGQ